MSAYLEESMKEMMGYDPIRDYDGDYYWTTLELKCCFFFQQKTWETLLEKTETASCVHEDIWTHKHEEHDAAQWYERKIHYALHIKPQENQRAVLMDVEHAGFNPKLREDEHFFLLLFIFHLVMSAIKQICFWTGNTDHIPVTL